MTLLRKLLPDFRFTERISYKNKTTMSALANGIQVPPGLTDLIPSPMFANAAQFRSLLSAEDGRKDKNLTFGLVTADRSVVFSDRMTQWKKVDYCGQPFWQFQGGDIFLDLTLGLYIYDHYLPKKGDPCTWQVLAVLVEHELLHIADEIDIVSGWFQAEAKKEPMVVQYLQEKQLVSDMSFQHWTATSYFETQLRDGLWADEHIRRIELRDSAVEYQKISDEIRDLQSRCKHGR